MPQNRCSVITCPIKYLEVLLILSCRIKKLNTHIRDEVWPAVGFDTRARAVFTGTWPVSRRVSVSWHQSTDGRHASCCKISCSLFIVVMDWGLYHTNRPTTRALICLSLILAIIVLLQTGVLYGIILFIRFLLHLQLQQVLVSLKYNELYLTSVFIQSHFVQINRLNLKQWVGLVNLEKK